MTLQYKLQMANKKFKFHWNVYHSLSNEQWVSRIQGTLSSGVRKLARNQKRVRGKLNPQGAGYPSSHAPGMESYTE